MSTKNIVPTEIKVQKQQGATHTRVICNFRLGLRHEIIYERNERFMGGDISILLDGKEVIREGIWSIAIGNYKRSFEIEYEPVGQVEILGLALGFFVKVLIKGVVIFEV